MLKDKLNGAETLVSEYLNRLQAWNTNKTNKVEVEVLTHVSMIFSFGLWQSSHRRNSEESSLNLHLRLSQVSLQILTYNIPT